MNENTTLGRRLIEHMPVVGVNTGIVAIAGFTLGEGGEHALWLAGAELAGGVGVNVWLHAVNTRYRRQLRQIAWRLRLLPKELRPVSLERIMELVRFLMRNPSQVAEVWWIIPKYMKGNKVFEQVFRDVLEDIYDIMAEARRQGARIKLAGVRKAKNTMSMIHNESLSGTGVMEMFTMSDKMAKNTTPMMFIRLRNNKAYAFDDLVFATSDHKHETRYASVANNGRHVANVKAKMQTLLDGCRVHVADSDIRPPRRRKKSEEESA